MYYNNNIVLLLSIHVYSGGYSTKQRGANHSIHSYKVLSLSCYPQVNVKSVICPAGVTRPAGKAVVWYEILAFVGIL